jgi:DNA-binding NarL/FixJ family response regulator
MSALIGLRDPFGLLLAAAAAVTLLAFQEGPLVAILAALSVLVFRVAAAPILGRWMPRPVPPTMPLAPLIPPGRLWYHPLTPRESEVALLVTDGLTTPQIAERMVSERTVDGHVTEKTVETHVQNIMNKLSKELGRDVNRRTQISAWVTERRPRDPVSRPSIPR